MADRQREIQSRPARLKAYLVFNRERIVVDLSVMAAWLLGTWTISSGIGFPTWLFYLVLFIGIIIYTRMTPPWARPYRSPDLPAESEELQERQDDRDEPE